MMSRAQGIKTAFVVVWSLAVAGCSTTSSLRRTTLSQGGTASDILSQMVLDNLALIRGAPGALPWHLKLTQGSIGITDQLSPTVTVNWSPGSGNVGISGSRQWAVSWTVVPEVEGSKLLKLRGLYQSHACRDPSVSGEDEKVACEQRFRKTYDENDGKAGAGSNGPCGSALGKRICVKAAGMDAFTLFVLDVLAAAPIRASERGIMLPGPQTGH